MRARASDAVLVDAWLSQASRTTNLLLVLAGSALMAACAQISVPLPWSPVPVTAQSFGVLVLAATLGAQRSAAALLLYLAEGAVGLPVFAPTGAPGIARLLGASGGYLLAFPLAAFVMGWNLERSGKRWWPIGVLAAEVIILVGGAAWLKAGTGIPWSQAWELGILAFLPGEILKVAVLGISLPAGWWALGRRRFRSEP
jgi:biotin transport system substrate-specific component